ncbi:MAG TPA: coproporphyrinogen III oxidase family protein [Firmicutes bacterium]|nr:coproporphyrinogen III oxidase family protein [Bacillota bacterium]
MPIGLYIHVPFCVSKCPYCDFYSLPVSPPCTGSCTGSCAGSRADPLSAAAERFDAYEAAVLRALEDWAARLPGETADTLYFGGGTPSLLGGARLARMIQTARRLFRLDGAEITLEANPADGLEETFCAFAAAGGNRISLGMQSASPAELRSLGRRHTPSDVEAAARAARSAGIRNLSLDLMLGLEHQTAGTVRASVEEAARLGAAHVSAYLLKIEEGTPYAARREELALPDEDGEAALYLAACEALEAQGYRQYEISNFARPGFASRHNVKYWNLQPYLGLGPSAHSWLGGRRFAYPRDLAGFLAGEGPRPERETAPSPDSPGLIAEGSEEEYILLRLRLTEGVDEAAFRRKFGRPLPAAYRQRAAALPSSLVETDERGIRLTREGFLLSNPITVRLLG